MSRTSSPSPEPWSSGRNRSNVSRNKQEYYPLWHSLLVALVGFMVYANAFNCGLAFDDMSAIKDNKDLRPETPLSQLLVNDFWGQSITKEHSHKSYRPLSVLTFRLNYLIDGINPIGYHIVNVVFHIIVSLLYKRLCNIFMSPIAALVASLSFSVHPIHTEAVTSVVGRAETLSSIFFLLAILTYIRAIKDKFKTGWTWFLTSIALVIMATLSKEQGITAIAICGVYEVFIIQKLTPFNIFGTQISSLRAVFMRLFLLLSSTCLIVYARLKIMGSQLPIFTRFDNPANWADTPARQLTYNYLLPLNSLLLIFPSDLCCDWTMGTILLIETFEDTRNVATIVFYLVFLIFIWRAMTSTNERTRQVLTISLSLIVFPFLPASNLFFPVGFVIAERVLYMPSLGFCMLFGYGFHQLYEKCGEGKSFKKIVLVLALVLTLSFHSIKTFVRNYDWESEYTIFTAGIKVNERNAKLYNNVGHALEAQSNYEEALQYFLKAVEIQADDIGAHINVGRTYNNLNQYELAEKAFLRAKDLLMSGRPGETYQARVAPSHLNVFLNLANLISRDRSRLEEADALYRQVIYMRSDYIQAYINRGDILIKMNRTREAQQVYEKALEYENTNPDIYYNLGVILLKQSKPSEALDYFNKALELEPNHEQSLLNSATIIQESGSSRFRALAQQRLHRLLAKGKSDERIYFNLGMLALDDRQFVEAENWLRAAIDKRPDFRSAAFNLALILSDSNRSLEAIPLLDQLIQYHPNHIKGLILLGDINRNQVKDLNAAEKCYRKIINVEPNNIQARHNLCVVLVERRQLDEAEQCLLEVSALAPNQDYIEKHLSIVRTRIEKLRQQRPTKDSL